LKVSRVSVQSNESPQGSATIAPLLPSPLACTRSDRAVLLDSHHLSHLVDTWQAVSGCQSYLRVQFGTAGCRCMWQDMGRG